MADFKKPQRTAAGGLGESEFDARSHKELVAELEEKLDRLRLLFEKYFLGIDKRPPMEQRAGVQRIIRYLQNKRINQTQVRFQFQTLVGRFNVFDQHWARILRKIEDGTYERDLFKAKLHQAQARGASPEGATGAEQAEPPAAAAEPEYGLQEEKIRRVYEDYLAARRQCGEAVEGLTLDRIRATLLREAPKIAQKNQAERVDFQVVIRDGRAILKAVSLK
jgi:hypothetical protein